MGRWSNDKFITEHYGFLNNLLPGDLVFADRGFDIQATVGIMMAQIKIPAFTKSKAQLSPLDVEAHDKLHMFEFILNV